MEITLISRYFDTRIHGIGSYSKLIYDSLNQKNVHLNTISEEDGTLPPKYPFSYLFYISHDIKRIIRKKYNTSDIYHCLNPYESLNVPKQKSISTILDFIPLIQKDNFNQKIYRKLFEKSIKSSLNCQKIIVINPDLKEKLISNYSADANSIEVISPPIDSKYQPLNKKNEKFTIGTVSALSPRKRTHILVESFLKADIENSKLIIGGNGPELEKLKNIANDDERIEFLGFVDDENMNEFYNSLDLFVFPTSIEGYGMPIVEAMACGKPVITLNDAIIPSNLKKRTFICSQKDLPQVLANKDYTCNIKNNIKFSKEHSIENIGSKLMKVYESI